MKPLWLLVTFGLSVAAHVGLAGLAPALAPAVIPGGQVSGEIALGLGFADLVAGSTGAPMTPVTPDKTSATMPTPPPDLPTAQPTSVQSLPATAPVSPSQTIAATPPQQPAEPAADPAKISAHKPEDTPPRPIQAKSAPPPSARGNAAVNNTKGRADGKRAGTATEANTKAAVAPAKQAGTGAIKSYQASVLRKIARVPKRAAGARGASFVRLSIAPSGAILSTQVVKSSGHAAIDTLAVSQIRRAGPFSPTPSGQSISVVVKFESKG